MSWVLFWKGILLLTLIGYGFLFVVVSIRGIGNIVDMLKDLKK